MEPWSCSDFCLRTTLCSHLSGIWMSRDTHGGRFGSAETRVVGKQSNCFCISSFKCVCQSNQLLEVQPEQVGTLKLLYTKCFITLLIVAMHRD